MSYIARCCNVISNLLSVLVEREAEMFELASKSTQRLVSIVFEMVGESVSWSKRSEAGLID